MGTLGWVLVVIVGIALGFSIGKFWPGSAKKMAELERDRDLARQDLQAYREDVNKHFARTAELFDKVTADYRGLYEHLAVGARQLGAIRGESTRQPLAEPEQRRLASTTAATAATSEAAAQQPRARGASETEAATTEVTETDDSLAVKQPAGDVGPETSDAPPKDESAADTAPKDEAPKDELPKDEFPKNEPPTNKPPRDESVEDDTQVEKPRADNVVTAKFSAGAVDRGEAGANEPATEQKEGTHSSR